VAAANRPQLQLRAVPRQSASAGHRRSAAADARLRRAVRQTDSDVAQHRQPANPARQELAPLQADRSTDRGRPRRRGDDDAAAGGGRRRPRERGSPAQARAPAGRSPGDAVTEPIDRRRLARTLSGDAAARLKTIAGKSGVRFTKEESDPNAKTVKG